MIFSITDTFLCLAQEEVCRKKWKSLRDTYLKETEKRSGSAAGSGKKLENSAVLSFLDPFVSPWETSGNMEIGDEENQAATETAAAGHSETGEPTGSFDGSEPGSPLPEPAASASLPAIQHLLLYHRIIDCNPTETLQRVLCTLHRPSHSRWRCRSPHKVVEDTRRLHTPLHNIRLNLYEAAIHPPL
ncbi:hypothetical protein DPX16_0960 [Anabarilius grahami]|uniref:Uncharacterized protein n=1 Tax=Anabarilius grahami TaxID=495550 RepID=A0A3N0YGD8_ANAGA|nr:hypothetical protein DPX16_0960 [Anabarilius grahami]